MRWATVSLVSEPEPLLVAFAAHHLEAGADRVLLFLDHPDAQLAARLRGMAGVVPTLCDARFWRHLTGGDRPRAQWQRQTAILRRLWQDAPEDFLLHVDADEFLQTSGDIAARLAGLPPEIDALLVPVAERVHVGQVDRCTIFGGVFRRPAPPDAAPALAAVYGEAARFLTRGVAGYDSGKSFFRTRGRLRPDIHAPEGDWTGALVQADDATILHFDGLTPRHWLAKRRRKLAQEPEWHLNPVPGRRLQFAAVAEAGQGSDSAAMMALFGQMNVLRPDQAAELQRLGLLFDPAFDPVPAVARRWPGALPDFSAARFDSEPVRMPPRPGPLRCLRRLAGRMVRGALGYWARGR